MFSTQSADVSSNSAANYNFDLPSYQIAADNHNYGNSNPSWTDTATWTNPTTNPINNAGKFISVSLASGLNSFYNTGVAVANWFGADVKENDIGQTLSALDDDLGKYYSENKESADVVGFIASSLIPGLAGVKVLNAGQKALTTAERGWTGYNMSKATGLLIPASEKYAVAAATEMAQTQAGFSILNSNVLKSVAAGLGQTALETTAFEIASTLTQFKSPVLEDNDVGDILHNIVIGTALGGTIGTVGTLLKTKSLVSKAIKEADLVQKPLTHINEYPGASASDRVIGRYADMQDMKLAIEAGNVGTYENNTLLATRKERDLYNKARTDIHSLVTGGDKELGNMMADSLHGSSEVHVMQNMFGAQEIGRVSTKLDAEKVITKEIKASGSQTSDLGIKYVKLLGEDAGAIFDEVPKLVNLADELGSEAEISSFVKRQKFDVTKPFDILDQSDHLAIEARYIWADNAALKEGIAVHEGDIPLLERALQQEDITNIKVLGRDGIVTPLTNKNDILTALTDAKNSMPELLQDKYKLTNPEIAKIVNVKNSYLEGTQSGNQYEDIFARQDAQRQYNKQLVDKQLKSATVPDVSIATKPTYAKIAYDSSKVKEVDENLLSGMVKIKQNYIAHQLRVDNAVASVLGKDSEQFWHPTDKMMLNINREGSKPGLFSSASGDYGTAASWAQQQGKSTNAIVTKAVNNIQDQANPAAFKLAGNQDVAVKFQALNDKIASTGEHYVLDGEGGLISKKLRDYQDSINRGEKAEVPKLREGAPSKIAITNADVYAAVSSHIDMTGARTSKYATMRNAFGIEDTNSTEVFRPIRPNPRDYPHIAFVVDDKVTGVGHTSMIHAASDKELQQLIAKVPPEYKVITKAESQDYHRAVGDFDYDKTLHDNYIDSSLKSNGVSTPFFQQTDAPKIAQDFMSYHVRNEAAMVREVIASKFEKEFSELDNLGKQYSQEAKSKYGNDSKIAKEVDSNNPYNSYKQTVLDLKQGSSDSLWKSVNTKLAETVDKAWNNISKSWEGVKSEADLDKVNKALQEAGVNTTFRDAALDMLSNHSSPKPALASVVSKMNAVMGNLLIRTDAMNAITDIIGNNVLLGTETKSLVRAIQQGNPQIAGELGQLLKVSVPGTDVQLTTAKGVIGRAIKNFFDPEAVTIKGEKLADFYTRNGFGMKIKQEMASVLDSMAIKGTESSGELNSMATRFTTKAKELTSKGLDKAELLTGNTFVNKFNNFITADVMRQLTDLGIKGGVIGEKEQLAYINTFINRVKGNQIASQRPLAFQGPVGQAIGLFQSYQFNMMQQMFRYVQNGQGKDAAMLLALQGSLYGMNGLPAFQAINEHLIGSQTKDHSDLYTGTYGVAGKQAGDFLLYGLPSPMLGANIYSRGDISPHNATIIPVAPSEIPAISATTKFFGNLINMTSKIADGGNVWQTMLQGIEHNGLSRPLSGLAQTAQAITNGGTVVATTNKGNISGANDLFSIATASRIVGGKPFDEAVANDALHRLQAYKHVDTVRKNALGEAVRSTLIAGNNPNAEQTDKFLSEFVAIGGKQRDFNRYMMKMNKTANTSQANAIADNLRNGQAQNMQRIMGGADMMDGNSINTY